MGRNKDGFTGLIQDHDVFEVRGTSMIWCRRARVDTVVQSQRTRGRVDLTQHAHPQRLD